MSASVTGLRYARRASFERMVFAQAASSAALAEAGLQTKTR